MNKDFFDLDKTLMSLSSSKGTYNWTIREAVEGVQIMGSIGSGKTSGSAQKIAHAYLENQFGGLVLTTKNSEKDMWLEYAKKTNRLNDIAILEPGGEHVFNFLQYESSCAGAETRLTENLVNVIKTVIKASESKSRSGGGDDWFWENALDMLLSNVIDLCLLSHGELDLQTMYDIALTAPKKGVSQSNTSDNQKPTLFTQVFNLAQENVTREIYTWIDSQPNDIKEAIKIQENFDKLSIENVQHARTFKFIDEFFSYTYYNLSEKTRSIIEFAFTGFLFRLMQEPVYSLFCKGKSTITPEDCLNGRIIIINLPVKIYHKVGLDCQILFKYCFQRAMERRDTSNNSRVVFLIADEAQNFIHEHDAVYQATARSSRIATMYITQNLPNYLASMNGDKSFERVKGFLGTLGTKIFHANADVDTNKYASELIGEAYTEDLSRSMSGGEKFSWSKSSSFRLERMVRPEQFVGLKTGGKFNNHLVQAYMHVQGRSFETGLNHRGVEFNQNL